MGTLRKIASALLMAAVGAAAGAASGGAATFYVYFIGAGPGALAGAFVGAVLGRRLPLRDTTLLFVAVYGGGIAGSALSARVTPGLAANDPACSLLELLLPVLGGVAGATVVYLPVRRWLPFARRRPVAAAAASLAAAWVLGKVYYFAYVWQP